MNDVEFLEHVNEKLKDGFTAKSIEKADGRGEGYISKRMRKLGYKYNKKTMQYEKNNTENNKNCNKTDNTNVLTQHEIEVLKLLVSEREKQQKHSQANLCTGEVTTRSFRTYKKVVNKFSAYCKKHKLNQADAVAQALIDFMNINHK